MFNTTDINLNVVKKDKFSGVFEITPLVRGFGYTIGSALRRTLYSATPGAAITKVHIEGISHQFSTIEGAKDDVLQILLNLKKVRFNKTIQEPIELVLDVTGPGKVTAKDIEVATEAKVVNKDLVITTLDSKKHSLKAILTVESGYGYHPVDAEVNVPLGTVMLDANFSPILVASIKVEQTRVGRDANYEKLTIKVDTDGTIDPEDAIRNAAMVLKEFFYKVQTGQAYISEEDVAMSASAEISDDVVADVKIPIDDIVLEELRLPTRTINALRKSGIRTLGDLSDRSEDQLLRVRNLGEKSIREILSLLEKENLR